MALKWVLLVIFVSIVVAKPVNVAQSPLITILHVTDVHGWVFAHPHDPTLDADFGDFVSLVEHMSSNAQQSGQEFFLFDSGDLIEGTGLSDATQIHGELIFPAFKAVQKYRGLTMGNHDIGHNDVVDFMRKNFIPFWNGSYLTSNSYMKQSNQFIGSPYSVFKTALGTKVVVLGFLYNFTQEANETVVEPVSQSLQEPYFKEAMKEAADADVIVVTAHIDPQSPPELSQIYTAIRSFYPSKPLILLSGHRHVKYFHQYDSNAFTIESGKYFEVLGVIQFSLVNGQLSGLNYQWVNTSRNNFYKLAQTSASNFPTPAGQNLRTYLVNTFNQLKLNTTLGCATQTYTPYASFYASNSLYRLYIEDVVPKMIYNSSLQYSPFFITNDGFLRYNLFQGRVVLNDMFTIIPFRDIFMYFVMSGSQLSKLISAVTVTSEESANLKLKFRSDRTPYFQNDADAFRRLGASRFYYSEGKIDSSATYSLVLTEYDVVVIGAALQKLYPNQKWAAALYPTQYDTTSGLNAYIQSYMPCSTKCPCS